MSKPMSRLRKLLIDNFADPEIKLVITQDDFEALLLGLSIRKECPGRPPVRLILADFLGERKLEEIKSLSALSKKKF